MQTTQSQVKHWFCPDFYPWDFLYLLRGYMSTQTQIKYLRAVAKISHIAAKQLKIPHSQTLPSSIEELSEQAYLCAQDGAIHFEIPPEGAQACRQWDLPNLECISSAEKPKQLQDSFRPHSWSFHVVTPMNTINQCRLICYRRACIKNTFDQLFRWWYCYQACISWIP